MTEHATEHATQNRILNALAGVACVFRANVGSGWTGDVSTMPDGSKLIRRPRPFSSGLPRGFADLVGWVPVVVTPEMVGQIVAVFVAVEVKTDRGRLTPEQARFLGAVRRDGGRAGVARSEADALAIVRGVE